jgi:GNAT superfamily N-acetyltransferase
MLLTTAPRSAQKIRTGTTDDITRAKDILLGAFTDDPPVRWIYADLEQYLTCFPQFIEAFAGRAFTNHSAFFAEEDRGVALWFPPGVEPDEQAVEAVLERTVVPERLATMGQVFEQMDRFHPTEPHWYLPLIGVRPTYHGQGLGAALLDHVLSICDQCGLPAYLEATSPRNAALYQRHGFVPVGEIRVARFPTLYPMKRAPVARWS